MDTPTQTAIFASLLTAGLAGSLHCMGMCGPILVGFSQAFERAAERDGKRASIWRDMAAYHVGRIWTYALFGFLAGLVGHGIRAGSSEIGWQKWAAVALSAAVIFSGLLLLGIIPGLRVEKLSTCGVKRFGKLKWFEQLIAGRGLLPRLLLGVVMGFLPCGLVYAMLAVAAVMPTPAHSALGMLVFGLGTLPSLTFVLGATRWAKEHMSVNWQARFRKHGTRIAAVMIIAAGGWMLFRSLRPVEHCCHAMLESPHEIQKVAARQRLAGAIPIGKKIDVNQRHTCVPAIITHPSFTETRPA